MNQRNLLSDEELLHLITARDVDAVAVLYDRHAHTLYNLILRIVSDPGVAATVLEETFWTVWQQAQSLPSEQVSAGWLCRVARELSVDHLRTTRSLSQASTTSQQGSASATG